MYLDKKVDLIITYVNYKDDKWKADYEKVAKVRVNDGMMERFRSFGTLRYLLRGVAKYMDYIDRIILVVAYETQVPKWVNRNTVTVITHDKFIPATHLPTFNSCTIESSFHRIAGLNPYIIYSNDDIFPLMPSIIEDFYTQSLPNTHFKFYRGFSKENMFRQQCKNGANLIYDVLKKKRLMDERKENPVFFKPDHCMSAMTHETLKTVGYLVGDELRKSCSPFRSFKNINQHIFLYYQYFMDKCYNKVIDYDYITFVNGIDNVCNDILNPRHKFICLNDAGLMSDQYEQAKVKVQHALRTRLPEKCKYEV